jgi:CelD/BcsL family acetyltransferase involved in cellulose biosynthesis
MPSSIEKLRIEIFDQFQDLLAIKENWNSVYRSDPEAQFFLSWTWISNWLIVIRRQSRWIILAAKLPGDPSTYVGFFPLRFRVKTNQRDGKTYHEIAMAGNRAADYTGFICVPTLQNEVIGAFAESIKRLSWHVFNLEFICASDHRIDLLLSHFNNRYFHVRTLEDTNEMDNVNLCRCPYVKLPSDWDAYLSHTLSANFRQKIRRLLRIVENSTDLRITNSTPETLERDLSILLKFWALKWGNRKGNRLQAVQTIYRTMLIHCATRGSLFLPVLWKGEIPLGALAILIDREKRSFLFYVAGRDTTVTSPPPGILLHAYSIRYAIQSGFATYEFLRGNEPYKYSFGGEERRVQHIVVTAKSARPLPSKI